MRSKAHRVDDEVELNPKLGQLTPYILRATRESAVAQSVVRRGGGGVCVMSAVRARARGCMRGSTQFCELCYLRFHFFLRL